MLIQHCDYTSHSKYLLHIKPRQGFQEKKLNSDYSLLIFHEHTKFQSTNECRIIYEMKTCFKG
jgi:hypothetical protein